MQKLDTNTVQGGTLFVLSQNQEIGQAFESRRDSTLLEQSPDFAGRFKKESDVFVPA